MTSLLYLVVRCHGQTSRLISSSLLKSLVETETVHTFAEALLTTDYREGIRKVAWTNLNGYILERLFLKKFLDRYTFISKVAVSSEVDLFFHAHFRRFEVQNIRRILRGKVAGTPKETIENSLMPLDGYSSVNFDALLDSEGINDAVKLLAETIYAPSQEALHLYENSKSLLSLEACLERAYAIELMKVIETLPEDREDVNRLVRISFDVRNCLSVVGGKLQGLTPRLLESLVIPYSFKVSHTNIVNSIRGEDTLSVVSSLFKPYLRVVKALLAREEATASVEGLRYVWKESESVRRLKPYSFAFILSYLISCEIEQRNLTTIALGKEYNLSPPDITAHLVTY